MSCSVVSSLPLFVTGATAVQLRSELGFGVAALGLAAATFRVSGVLLAPNLGRLVDRVGPWRSLRMAALISGVSAAGIALLARDLATLCLFLFVGGSANALGEAGANLSVSRGVPARQQGTAFGVKQSALPAGSLLAGIAVPVVALQAGWRATFLAATGLSVLAILAAGRRVGDERGGAGQVANRMDRRGPLLVLSLGLMFSMAAATALPTFAVDSAVTLGISAAGAGWLLALGSLSSILIRVAVGFWADRRPRSNLGAVAALIGLGSVGFCILGSGRESLFAVGLVVAFAFGWGFNGLFWFAIVRLNRSTPGRATGTVMPGGLFGGIAGPLAFGSIVELQGYSVAWFVAASWGILGCGLVLLGRWLVRRGLADGMEPRSPPAAGPDAPSFEIEDCEGRQCGSSDL